MEWDGVSLPVGGNDKTRRLTQTIGMLVVREKASLGWRMRFIDGLEGDVGDDDLGRRGSSVMSMNCRRGCRAVFEN